MNTKGRTTMLDKLLSENPDIITRCRALCWTVNVCWQDVKRPHLANRNYVQVWLHTYLTNMHRRSATLREDYGLIRHEHVSRKYEFLILSSDIIEPTWVSFNLLPMSTQVCQYSIDLCEVFGT